MKNKHYIAILTVMFGLFVFMFLASCTGYRSISGIEMKNKETIDVISGNFNYDDDMEKMGNSDDD